MINQQTPFASSAGKFVRVRDILSCDRGDSCREKRMISCTLFKMTLRCAVNKKDPVGTSWRKPGTRSIASLMAKIMYYLGHERAVELTQNTLSR